jgi:putative cell wall-binding protein
MATTHAKSKKKWSADVTEHSGALDLESNVFESKDPKHIAQSLKKSAEQSHRRKSAPYRSAMSMLTFYINRAGKNLEASQKEVLEKAKGELKKLFGRE